MNNDRSSIIDDEHRQNRGNEPLRKSLAALRGTLLRLPHDVIESWV
jgi:hypothetical protein